MSQRTSSAAVPDGTADKPKTTSGLRSDATRPRSSRASITSTGAGSLLTSSAGATGTGSTATAGLRQPGSSSIPTRTGRLSSNSIQQLTANGGSSSAGITASRLPSASTALAAAHEARQQQPAVAAVPASSAAALTAAAGTPITPLLQPGSSTGSAYLQSNALYGHEHSSMTPSVRHKEYTPSLSPDMELAARAAADASAAATAAARGMTPAGGHVPLSTPTGLLQQPQQLVAAGGLQQVWAPAATLPAVCKAPKAYLQTTGDLFAAPDQGAEEKLVVKMGSAQLVSPAWNQSRPWLTGSWLMQYPADFVAEVGGATDSAGGVQLPPTCDLFAAAPTQQEAALVDDLMGVFLGQAGQYVVHAMVEGPKWQRLALQVKGVTEPSLVEQVERLLPLCECVYIIKRFVETRSRIDHPKVAQALAAAMRELQREWWLVVVQLDHLNRLGQLSLASLVYYCREPTASMQLLASIAVSRLHDGEDFITVSPGCQ
ncbi:hypothetical protein COO60DRAFT_464443 [Scenedesmus sp. NREL 46B-D3]|nr:hypothetical protein COO60DRAFT_464443 [Scenedesmus sp. NREL 46B-D3]